MIDALVSFNWVTKMSFYILGGCYSVLEFFFRLDSTSRIGKLVSEDVAANDANAVRTLFLSSLTYLFRWKNLLISIDTDELILFFLDFDPADFIGVTLGHDRTDVVL